VVEYERRGAPRYAFAGIAEVNGAPPSFRVGRVKDLSRLGAYIAVVDPFPTHSGVFITISTAVSAFRCEGTVANSTRGIGMGITFRNILPASQAVLDEWLNEMQSR